MLVGLPVVDPAMSDRESILLKLSVTCQCWPGLFQIYRGFCKLFICNMRLAQLLFGGELCAQILADTVTR